MLALCLAPPLSGPFYSDLVANYSVKPCPGSAAGHAEKCALTLSCTADTKAGLDWLASVSDAGSPLHCCV